MMTRQDVTIDMGQEPLIVLNTVITRLSLLGLMTHTDIIAALPLHCPCFALACLRGCPLLAFCCVQAWLSDLPDFLTSWLTSKLHHQHLLDHHQHHHHDFILRKSGELHVWRERKKKNRMKIKQWKFEYSDGCWVPLWYSGTLSAFFACD
jgi:hypothetical protein